MDIQQIDEPAARVAVHRRTIAMADIRDFYDHAYSAVAAALGARGGAPAGPALGWYHGMPAGIATISAGFPVEGIPLGDLDEDVAVVRRPGGAALVAVHAGSYDTLDAGWVELMAEPATRGVAPRGDFWEEYLTDPLSAADPSELRTRLVLPLA